MERFAEHCDSLATCNPRLRLIRNDIYCDRALVFEHDDEDSLAILEYRRAIGHAPDFDAYHSLGMLYSRHRRYWDALRCYDSAASLVPWDAILRARRASVLKNIARVMHPDDKRSVLVRALDEFNLAVMLDPKNERVREIQELFRMIDTLVQDPFPTRIKAWGDWFLVSEEVPRRATRLFNEHTTRQINRYYMHHAMNILPSRSTERFTVKKVRCSWDRDGFMANSGGKSPLRYRYAVWFRSNELHVAELDPNGHHLWHDTYRPWNGAIPPEHW
ncbi:MAG: hypothetical protein GF331_09280 [Chitinivibrionales bacterium]|nr:hypothetical protein [Chitinivibrionales bacterium]